MKRRFIKLLKRIFIDEGPKPEPGFAVWCEYTTGWRTAPIVDPDKFGPHTFDGPLGVIGTCSCGAWMSSSYSGGPVDPFGACPNNPKHHN